MNPYRLAVVGAGVTGLAAARELVRRSEADGVPLEVAVFEMAERVGGRVFSADFFGGPVDLGAESMLIRRPETLDALGALGLSGKVVRPGTTAASIWNGRRLVPIPGATSLGVPTHPLRRDVVRLLGLRASLRAASEPWVRGPAAAPDDPLGPFLEGRIGRQALRRLVDPLLGGVYAGPADLLSVGAVAPQLLEALKADRSLLRGLRRRAPAAGVGFVSLLGGLQGIPDALALSLPPGALRLATRVTRLARGRGTRVRLTTGAGGGQSAPEVDGVVLAVPSPQAAELVQPLCADLGRELRRQPYSRVATVTMAYPESALTRKLYGSGFLIPGAPGRVVTACTFLDRKWPHLRREGWVLLRASVGGLGAEWTLDVDDATLVTSVHTHLRRYLGLAQVPGQVRVQRWEPAIPQYRTGHLAWRERVAGLAAGLPPPVVLAGAAFRGVGLEACLRDGTEAGGTLWSRVTGGPRDLARDVIEASGPVD